jgi:hypothetical protein
MPNVRFEEARGSPLTREGVEITPIEHVARVTWRGGQLAWRRPVAIEVREGVRIWRAPIHDVTRRAQIAALLVMVALGWLAVRTRLQVSGQRRNRQWQAQQRSRKVAR